MKHCATVVPPMREARPEHWVACHLYDAAAARSPTSVAG
jgi:hypothetical protein